MALVCIKTCDRIFEANLIKTRLIDSGVDCFLTNENYTSLYPACNGLLGSGIRVMIEEEDADKALDLLGLNSESKIKCPNCNSENITNGSTSKKSGKVLAVLMSLLALIPFTNHKQTYCCKDCKTEF